MPLSVEIPAPVDVEAHRLANCRSIHGSHAQPAPGSHFDDTLCHECANGLPDDGARDAELLAELPFGRKAIANLKSVRKDRGQHHVGDLVRESWFAGDLLEQGGTVVRNRDVAVSHECDPTSYSMPIV